MAYIAAFRVVFAFFALICLVIGVGGIEENDRSLLNFEVSLPGASGRVEFVCDLGDGFVEASNSINLDSSELNLWEEVVVLDHSNKGVGEIICWREKLDIPVPLETLEDLGSQIQGFLKYRPRSLLANQGSNSPSPTAQTNVTGKTSKDNSSGEDPSKKDLAVAPQNETRSPKSEEKPPKNDTTIAVDDDSGPPPPPKDNESFPPPPPPPREEKDKEKDEPKETPVDPGNQSTQHHDTDDSKYNVCEQGKDLVPLLQTSGDGTQTLTLSLRNDGEGVLDVQIKTPTGLLAEPSTVRLKKGEPAIKVKISVWDKTLLSDEENILISSSEGNCTVRINLNALGNSDTQSYFDRFSMPHMPAVVTPEMRLGAFFFILSIVGGLVIWRMWARWRPRDAGAGHSYQELEMTIPSTVDNLTSAYGQEKADKSGSGDEEGWDEVWDDWEDTEAARSSSRLIPSLSAKGLAARRSNKDGWETSWDD